ncbi:MAG: autotransporter assembly complex protein TamB [Symbiopectobacterium sp.]|uniref:autotransporter assembly complex protein TamB n=1 Tax=Symbiopectobacterium sp. TaxID=2952789 RepID=UPI0039EBE7D9
MSLIKKIGIGAIAFLLLLFITLAGLLFTTPGLHLLLNGAARWVSGLEIAEVQGGWRDLTLRGVGYQTPGITLKAGELHLALELGCLARSQICVNDIALRDLDVVIDSSALPPPAEAPAPSEPVGELSAPFPIRLSQLTLNNIRVTLDDTALSLGELRTGMHWEGRALTLLPTQINALLVALPKTKPAATVAESTLAATEDGKVTASEVGDIASATAQAAVAPQPEAAPPAPEKVDMPPPLGEQLQALFAKPLLPALPEFTLPLDVDISDLRGEQLRLTGDQDITITTLQLQASTQQQHIQLARLAIQSPQGAIHATGEAMLSDNWPLSFILNGVVNTEPLKGEKIKLTVDGSLHDWLNTTLNLSGPQRALLTLKAQLAQPELPLVLTMQSEHLAWPLTGDAEYQVNNLALSLTGKATDYALKINGDIRGSAVPPASLALEGNGNLRQFDISPLRLSALQGTTELRVLVDWSKAISWRSELVLDGINTAKQWPEWPARIDGKISTRGSFYGGNWQVAVTELRLNGNIKQNKLTAQGSLSGNAAGQWSIPGINLALGRNQLDVKGELGKQWQLDGVIDAPALNGALPGLAGRVAGTVRLRGNHTAQQPLADLNATGLRWQGLSIERLTLESDVRSEAQVNGRMALRVEQLRQEGISVSLLTLNAQGNEQQHQLRLNVEGEPVAGQLALTGHFDRAQQRWHGTLDQTHFTTLVGEWRLSPSMSLDYQQALACITLGAHCWQNPNAELCGPRAVDIGPSGQASVVLNRFDLAMLEPFLGSDTALSGVFTGRADVAWQPGGGLPQVKIALTGNKIALRQQMNGNTLPVDFDTFTLNAGVDRGRATLGWLIAIHNNGQFRGDIQVTDPQGRRQLGGDIAIDKISLALLNPALSRGEKAAGMLNGALRVGGNVRQPQLNGQLALEGLDIDGHWMPVDLTDGRLAVNFNGMSSTLQGFLKTTQGQLNLSGDADWRQPEAWRARIAAKGDRVRVTLPPTVRLDVSPDIEFEATPQLFTLNGSVKVPWARITVQDMPENAVDVSYDEVLLDEQRQPLTRNTAAIPINSNLTIRVGDDVRLDAFGLRASLQGDLKMVQDERSLGLNGQINIPTGRFKAYGQDLIVQKGILVFSGPPAEPNLNIEAVRNPDNTADGVTAGVRITGAASAPHIEVFSTPTLSQQEALSYLLRGQGLDSTGSDSNMMTSALVGLGVAQSGQVVGRIGEAFGVSDLALDTQGAGDESQVVVSGYVLPDLQVRYGIGIFDSLATLTLRYRLMPRLYLEAVSGLDQALNVLYQFEF